MNKIFYIVRKLRQWGVKGILLYLRFALAEWKMRARLMANVRRYPVKPQLGVTVMMPLGGSAALNKVGIDFVLKLREAGIPHQVYDLSVSPPDDFRMMKYTDVIDMFYSFVPAIPGLRKSTVAFWEFESGLLEQCPRLADGQQIVAMSDFNFDYYRKTLPARVGVRKILYPLRSLPDTIPSKADIRRKYGVAETDFVVFFNFDYGSGYGRKNPEGCIRAFSKAFRNEPSARLLFKTKRAAEHPDGVARIRECAASGGVADRVISEDRFIPDADLIGLTNACDVYLSLHRGEGFGLGIAEAMQLAKPVIVTDWSSTTEFCNESNSFPVSYRLVPAKGVLDDQSAYACVRECAEPDIDDAAEKLRAVFDDRELGHRIGLAARQSIHERYSTARFAESMMEFLK